MIVYAINLVEEFLVRVDTPEVLIFQQQLYYSAPSMKFCLKRKQVPYGDIESTQVLNPIQCKCQTPNMVSTCSCFNLQQESRQCQIYKQIGSSYNTLWFTIDGVDTSFQQTTLDSSYLTTTLLTIDIDEFSLQNDLFIKNLNDSVNIDQLDAPTIYLTGGQWLLLEYSITVKSSYYNQFWGLVGLFQKNVQTLSIEWHKTDFPDLPQKDTIVVGIRGKSNSTRYEVEKFQLTMMGNISNLGGFYTACAGIFFYLFGNPKLSPWGITQKVIFVCWPCRRSFQRQLANRYVSSAGIPFGEKVKQMPPNSSIEERLQIVEIILKDYYIDTYYIDQLKLVKRKYRKKKRDYEELEPLPPDDDLTLNDYENSPPTQRNSLIDNVNDRGRIYSRSRTSSYNHQEGSSGSNTPSVTQLVEFPINENNNIIDIETILKKNKEENNGNNIKRQSRYSRSLGTDNITNSSAINRSSRRNTLLNFDE
ncbi:hypothetical protein RclHR1_05890004 [Rhizophagus clarus]|uniref:Uncharacterized protein n=1 Tax=Rhizophagus clarus TaxID=94130 RepID=A0A2Z6RVB6_9GLOM|nr:hypothetical protein RclHR1_05890004 [Rhizophagus clarus]